MSYNSKYSGAQVEELLDQVANAKETDPVFAASPAASITDEQIAGWEGKQGKLTFDTEPIEGSSNPVTSDGIFKALSKIDISIFLPVATLPTEDINPNKVYLVKDAEGESGNMFAEYIYTDGAWELIGRSKINLEDYYTKSEIDALFANVKVEGVLTEEDIATVNGQKLTNGGNILISAETIVLDAEPTEGSVNGVTSGGVYPLRKRQACFESALPLLRAILKKGLYTEDVTSDIDSLIELLAKGTPDDVARPIITIDENNYVHITCEDKDASIYYSLYGDDAKRGSLFTEPFSMQWNCTIKAVAVLDDKSSPVAEKTYKAIENEYIEFADPLLAKLAIMPTTETFTAEDGTQYNGFGWDKDGDGRVSKKDAAAVISVTLNSNKGVKNFEEFVFFEGIKSMTSYELYGCACDTIITPPSLKIIGNHVFTQADTRKLIISEGCETLGGLTYVSVEYLSLPQSLKTLGVIGNCGATIGLDVTIPASLESLPQLYNCTLNEVKIMGNYTSMRSDAFQYSKSPSGVTAKIMLASENVMVLSEAFKNFGISTATFYVRDELLEQYKVAEFWSAHYDAGRIKGISEW